MGDEAIIFFSLHLQSVPSYVISKINISNFQKESIRSGILHQFALTNSIHSNEHLIKDLSQAEREK